MSSDGAAPGDGPLFLEIGQVRSEAVEPFRPIHTLTWVVMVILGLRLAVILVVVIGLVLRFNFIEGFKAGRYPTQASIEAAAGPSDAMIQMGTLASLGLLVLGYIVAGIWIYRAGKNVRALGARGLENSPGWAVGWYAIPFANLIKPFQAMSEIWRASHSPQSWRGQALPPLLGFWWAGWLASLIAGNVLNAIVRSTDQSSVDGLKLISQLLLVDMVISSVAAALFMTVVWKTSLAQSATRHLAHQVADTFA